MVKRILCALVLLALTVPLMAQQYITVADKTVSTVAVTVFTASAVQEGSGHPQAVAASC